MDQANQNERRKRGIYLLPNLFTTAVLFGGFFAILSAIDGQFEKAAIAVFVAMVMDGLDGRVARLTNTQTPFGAEYDSLSDMVAFGLAPGLVMYLWALQDLGRLGWLAAFVYVAGAALRLARFNTQVGIADKRYFQGLASPAAAAVVMGFVWFCEIYHIAGEDVIYGALLLTLSAGLLMVSRFPYYSFKDLDIREKVPFVTLLAAILVFIFLSLRPATVLFSFFFLYMMSGPVISLFRWNRKRTRKAVSGGGSGPNT